MKDIIIAIIGLILLGLVWLMWRQIQTAQTLSNGGVPEAVQLMPNDKDAIFCTADAKLCPDGSGVGRVGPNCEFALCPGETVSE